MRAHLLAALAVVGGSVTTAAGCVQLGVVGDATSLSIGKPSLGHLVDGIRIPDRGEGFFAPETWRTRGNRYGTDELVDLLVGVARRLAPAAATRLAVADLARLGGGEAHEWHRSHQSGRDVDLIYFQRDGAGKPVEPSVMHVFDRAGLARDGSGATVDIPRTWKLVRELVMAPEAPVQWIFMYEPFAARVIEYARSIGEPDLLVAVARRTLKQPGDSAKHDDHMHIRVYCADSDRSAGCVDTGPLDLFVERETQLAVLRAQTELGLAFATKWWQVARPVQVALASTTLGDAATALVGSASPDADDGENDSSVASAGIATVCMADVVPPDLEHLAKLLRSRSLRLDFALR